MLEIRNITKIYRSKTGEEVRALDNVSIQFPESGMVFILGKSGSGKSTLLNVMGGLDSYDSGEFVIKGKSSADFGGSDFDAYRNTFIGFIFQEYNVLDDFTVGANIGLALELQGKKATDEAVNGILAQVELLDYAKRKPNELSGGQKQRVAIARALVKEPEIIMADEPTGALDSNTGKQIFDTLKELSKQKLVLVVSHDRDFAERYADRIIELADGRIIEDVTKHERAPERISEGVHRINDRILRIECGYRLSANDLEMINEYLAKSHGDVLLSGDGRVNDELRSAVGISRDGTSTVFEGTVPGRDVKTKTYEKNSTKFIRSRLPMKNAVKMGSSSLRHKTVRLIFTILLSLISFAMFGIADTMAAYNKIEAATNSIRNAQIKTASYALMIRETRYDEDGEEYYYNQSDSFNDEDIAKLKELTGLNLVPVFNGSTESGRKINFSGHYLDNSKEAHTAYNGAFSGFVSLDEAQINEYGFNILSGRLPEAQGEIMITKHVFDHFAYYGYRDNQGNANIRGDVLVMEPDVPNSIIGHKLELSIGHSTKAYTIVGVLDTHFDTNRYAAFLPSAAGEGDNGNNSGESSENGLMLQLLGKELANTLSYDFHCLGVFSEGQLDQLFEQVEKYYKSVGTHMNNFNFYAQNTVDNNSLCNFWMVAGNSALSSLNIEWLDGTSRTALGEKEIVVSTMFYQQLLNQKDFTVNLPLLKAKADELLGADELYLQTDPEMNILMRLYQYQEQASLAQRDDLAVAIWDTLVNELRLELEDVTFTAAQKADILREICSNAGEKISLSQITQGRAYAYVYSMLVANDYALVSNDAFLNALRWQPSDDSEEGQSKEEWASKLVWQAREWFGWYEGGYLANPYGVKGLTKEYFEKDETNLAGALCGFDPSDLSSDVYFVAETLNWDSNGNEQITPFATYNDWKIVGLHSSQQELIISETLNVAHRNYALEQGYSVYEYAAHAGGNYSHLIAPMPMEEANVQKLIEVSYDESGEIAFKLKNNVMDTLDTFNEFVEPGATIFLFVGLGLALFASVLLMNFISTSISYKKREIGILRAVGARSSDVFKIFFSEAAIIALINFVLSLVAALTATYFLNDWMASEGINVTLLNFGIRQGALMLGVSLLAGFLASFLPVYRIAHKKPVDAIKDR